MTEFHDREFIFEDPTNTKIYQCWFGKQFFEFTFSENYSKFFGFEKYIAKIATFL